jgi:beta-glucosidase/6-phospho-beta-glucosidase/beta-galactosidase
VGIENCWIAQTNPQKDGNRRLLDVFLQIQHYEKWKADLDLAKDIGFNAIRYSVPWYKSEPKPGVYDWSWIDKPIEYLVNKLKIIPIMDLIHYGTPTWMEDGVVDDRFPEAIGQYAGAMAKHFKGLVNHYSPHNEPQLTCQLCGLVGRWPPYEKNIDGWAKIGIRVAKGIDLEMQAIREATSDAVIVSIDPFFDMRLERYGSLDRYLPSGAENDSLHKELMTAAAVYPSSLAYGKVKAGHPLASFLKDHGVTADELAWFERNSARPDILGTNYYPDIAKFAKDGDFTRKGSVPLDRAAVGASALVKNALTNAQSYFSLPIYLTETSAGLTTEAKIAYINALYDMTLAFRKEKFLLVGINWWPLFETIQWDYREKVDKPLTDFIYPGGWNNGLYVTKADPNGDLKRIRTGAADAYHAIIEKDLRYKWT